MKIFQVIRKLNRGGQEIANRWTDGQTDDRGYIIT
jgi:hypothetical protein